MAWLQYSLTVCLHPPSEGTKSYGILNGFNKTVLRTLPRSRNLIVVESVLMAVAFLAMLLVRFGLVGRRWWEQEVLSLQALYVGRSGLQARSLRMCSGTQYVDQDSPELIEIFLLLPSQCCHV